MEGLAYKLWLDGKKSIHYSALTDVIGAHLKSKIKTIRDLEAADYEVRTASFLVRDSEGNYSFAHRSFQEFFLARKIKKALAAKDYDILDTRRLSLEVIFFLRYLVADDDAMPAAMAGLLERKYDWKVSENALLLFYTVLKISFLEQRFSLSVDTELTADEAREFRERVRDALPSKMDLSSAALSGINLPHMVFHHSNIDGAQMEAAVLTGAVFEDVDFDRALLEGSDFSGSVFRKVLFDTVRADGCRFKGCRFEHCTFLGSAFGSANFMDTVFENCTLAGNDFTGSGFLGSNIDWNSHPTNTRFGIGKSACMNKELIPTPGVGH